MPCADALSRKKSEPREPLRMSDNRRIIVKQLTAMTTFAANMSPLCCGKRCSTTASADGIPTPSKRCAKPRRQSRTRHEKSPAPLGVAAGAKRDLHANEASPRLASRITLVMAAGKLGGRLFSTVLSSRHRSQAAGINRVGMPPSELQGEVQR
jgi:hypothetical protein